MSANGVCFCSEYDMEYIEGSNRHQNYFATLEEQVSADNTARLVSKRRNEPDYVLLQLSADKEHTGV